MTGELWNFALDLASHCSLSGEVEEKQRDLGEKDLGGRSLPPTHYYQATSIHWKTQLFNVWTVGIKCLDRRDQAVLMECSSSLRRSSTDNKMLLRIDSKVSD